MDILSFASTHFLQEYFNLSEWKTPFFRNLRKFSKILEGYYLSKFKNEGGRILDFYVKNANKY